MSTHSILSIGAKVFGLYFFALAAIDLRNIIVALSFQIGSGYPVAEDVSPVFLPLISVILDVVIGLVLIYKSDVIASKLNASLSDSVNLPVTKRDIVEIALIAIGFIAVLNAIPLMFQKLVSYAYFNPYDRPERSNFWTDLDTAAMIYSVFEFVAGLFLVLNARSFARKLQRVSDREDARVL